MMEVLQEFQLDLMLALSGIGVAFAGLVLISKALSRRRRLAIVVIELIATMILIFDRLAYVYSGDVSSKGYTMVRVSNFMVFLLMPLCALAIDHYIMNVVREDLKLKIPRRLWTVCIISFAGTIFVVIARMTDLFYYFDEMNKYHRAPLFMLSYIVPVVTTFLMS